MVDVFGQGLKRGPTGPQGDEGPPGKKGDKGDPGKNGFNELFNWFPQLAVEQIRKNVNFITFLIETLPSSKNDDDSDVKIDENNRVIEWRSLNYLKHGKVIFVPMSKQGSKLKNFYYLLMFINAMDSNLKEANKMCTPLKISTNQF